MSGKNVIYAPGIAPGIEVTAYIDGRYKDGHYKLEAKKFRVGDRPQTLSIKP